MALLGFFCILFADTLKKTNNAAINRVYRRRPSPDYSGGSEQDHRESACRSERTKVFNQKRGGSPATHHAAYPKKMGRKWHDP